MTEPTQRLLRAVIHPHKVIPIRGVVTQWYAQTYKVIDLATFTEDTGHDGEGHSLSAARTIANRVNGFDSTAEELLL